MMPKGHEESFSVINTLYTGVLDRRILCFGSSRTHIIVKKWNIILHVSWHGEGIASTCLDHVSLMDLSIILIIYKNLVGGTEF